MGGYGARGSVAARASLERAPEGSTPAGLSAWFAAELHFAEGHAQEAERLLAVSAKRMLMDHPN